MTRAPGTDKSRDPESSSTAFLVGGVAVMVLYASGYVAEWVGDAAPWWAELLVIGRELVGIVLVSFGVSALLSRRLVLAAIFLGAWGVMAVADGVSLAPSRGGGDPFVVVSLNAQPEALGLETAERFRTEATEAGVSVIAWQEHPVTYRMDQPGYTSAPTLAPVVRGGAYRAVPPGHFSEAAVGSESREIVHIVNPILSSLPWVSHAQDRLGSMAPPSDHSPYTRAVLRWQGREVAVYNVHLASYSRARPWRRPETMGSVGAWRRFFHQVRRDLEVRSAEVAALREVLARETRPYVVVGDLNSVPGQRVYNALASEHADAYAKARWTPGFTFHARLPFVRIDYVFASPHWEVVDADVLPGIASDHRAVVASLRLKPESASGPMSRAAAGREAPLSEPSSDLF